MGNYRAKMTTVRQAELEWWENSQFCEPNPDSSLECGRGQTFRSEVFPPTYYRQDTILSALSRCRTHPREKSFPTYYKYS